MENDYWKKYSDALIKIIGGFEPNDELLSLYSITDNIGALYAYIKDGLIDKVSVKDIIETIGHMYYDIACLELQYDLPGSLYTKHIGHEVDISMAESIDLQDCHLDYINTLSSLSLAISSDDLPLIQFNLNTLVTITFDICIRFGVNTLVPLKYNLMELENLKSPIQDSKKSDYKKDEKKRKEFIKNLNLEEVLFDVILDNRSKNPYKGIKLKAFNKISKFNNGDIIVDFFRAMTFVDKNKPNDDYAINYGKNYREYLNKNADKIWSGFLVEDSILTVMDIQQRQEAINGTVSMGKEARPIVMNNKIKDLDTLIDYIHEKEK